MPDTGIVEITEPIELRIVDDRLIFTCTSGKRQTTYSISFHKAANAVMCTNLLLDQQRKAPPTGEVIAFKNR